VPHSQQLSEVSIEPGTVTYAAKRLEERGPAENGAAWEQYRQGCIDRCKWEGQSGGGLDSNGKCRCNIGDYCAGGGCKEYRRGNGVALPDGDCECGH
jgi:hypothetical protein